MTPAEARTLLQDLMEFHEERDTDQTLRELNITIRGTPHPILRIWTTPHGSIRTESQPAPNTESSDWPSLGALAGSIESWNIGMVWKKNAQILLQQHGMEPDEARGMLLKLHRESGTDTVVKKVDPGNNHHHPSLKT